MKIPSLKEFMGGAADLVNYLKIDHNGNLKELAQVLRRLTFEDNFNSFIVTLTIPAASEIGIENKIGVIPSKRFIVRSTSYEITDGASAWTSKHVYMKNHGAAEATVTILFVK